MNPVAKVVCVLHDIVKELFMSHLLRKTRPERAVMAKSSKPVFICRTTVWGFAGGPGRRRVPRSAGGVSERVFVRRRLRAPVASAMCSSFPDGRGTVGQRGCCTAFLSAGGLITWCIALTSPPADRAAR